MKKNLDIKPIHASVGSFFKKDPIFLIPKYQRSYSWTRLEIEDFINDLKKCYHQRVIIGYPINHFFGGIVSVKREMEGVVDQHSYSLVDGQQRMATFVLLMASIRNLYAKLEKEAGENSDYKNESIIKKRIEKLTRRAINFEVEVHRDIQDQDVLRMSKVDERFYRELILGNDPVPSAESHERLAFAYRIICETVIDLALNETQSLSLEDRMDNLEQFDYILSEDFSIINMVTTDRKEAYKLFQVLNNRGKNLTEGDLLRSHTLEKLESFVTEQQSAEALWESILSGKSEDVSRGLHFIYASHKGEEAGTNTLFQDFTALFFPMLEKQDDDFYQTDANKLVDTLQKLNEDVLIVYKLLNGEWPFDHKNPVVSWDRERLRLLIKELGHIECIPFLLSAHKLGHKRFSEIVQILELIVFRYLIICDLFVGELNDIYFSESVKLRETTPIGNYQIPDLKNKLKELLDKECTDELFLEELNHLRFYEKGKSNKPLKYFFMTLEYFYDQESRNVVSPLPFGKEFVYDFNGSNLEHIYPQNADESYKDQRLEELKNKLGNITFMSQFDNSNLGNVDYATKREAFSNSKICMNQHISETEEWTVDRVRERSDLLKQMACTVFNLH